MIQLGIQLTKITAPYLIRKRGVFYLQKRIPKDLVNYYGKEFIRKSLKTKDRNSAIRISSHLITALEREWLDKRFNLSESNSVHDVLTSREPVVPILSEALQTYCQMKGKLDNKRFYRHVSRVIGEVISVSGDKMLSAYSRADAIAFRDRLLEREVASATVKRNFECVRAVWNYSAREHGIQSVNPFANMNYGNGAEPVKRKPIPMDVIKEVQSKCYEIDDEIRWIIALLSDTGMRLAEAVGLHIDDIMLEDEIPHLRLIEHPWRPLKTKGSSRLIPLVGAAEWAVTRAIESSNNGFLFPRYCSKDECKSDYASNSLNKWLRNYVPEGCVIHSFRHSMRDRLMAIQCPSDMFDQIGGWTTDGIGEGYGRGYP